VTGKSKRIRRRTDQDRDNTFCIVVEWTSFDKLAAARSHMIGLLDSFWRDPEDLGNNLGVTDPVSGEVVLNLAMPNSAKKDEDEIEKRQAQKATLAYRHLILCPRPAPTDRREHFRGLAGSYDVQARTLTIRPVGHRNQRRDSHAA
jgi:hypothetical protein